MESLSSYREIDLMAHCSLHWWLSMHQDFSEQYSWYLITKSCWPITVQFISESTALFSQILSRVPMAKLCHMSHYMQCKLILLHCTEVSCFQLSKEIVIIKSNADVRCSVKSIPNMNMNFYPLHSYAVLLRAMPLHTGYNYIFLFVLGQRH